MKKSVASKNSPKSADMGFPFISSDGGKTRPSISMNSPLHFSSVLDMVTHADISTTNQSLLNHKNLMLFSSRNTSLHRSHLSNEEFLKSISSNIALTNIIEKNNLLENIQVNSENIAKNRNTSIFQKLEQISGIYQPHNENELIGKFKENMFKRFDFRKKSMYDDNELRKLNEKKDESNKEERSKKISFTTLSRISDRKSGEFNFSPNSYNFFDFNTPNNQSNSNVSNGKLSLKKFLTPGVGHRKTKTEIPNYKSFEHKLINKTSVFLDNAKKTLDKNTVPRKRSSERKKSDEMKKELNEMFLKYNDDQIQKEKITKVETSPIKEEEHVNKNNNNNVNINIINDNLTRPQTPETNQKLNNAEKKKINKKIKLQFQSLGTILDLNGQSYLEKIESREKEEIQEEKGEREDEDEEEGNKNQREEEKIKTNDKIIDNTNELKEQKDLYEKIEKNKEETNEKKETDDSQEKSPKYEVSNFSKRNSQLKDPGPDIKQEIIMHSKNEIKRARSSSSINSLVSQADEQIEGVGDCPFLKELKTPNFISQPPFPGSINQINEIPNNLQNPILESESKHLIETCQKGLHHESDSDFSDSNEQLNKFSTTAPLLLKIPLCESEVHIPYSKTPSENSEERKENEEEVIPIQLIYSKNISDKIKSNFFFKNSKRNSLKDNSTIKNSSLRKLHKTNSSSQLITSDKRKWKGQSPKLSKQMLDINALACQTEKLDFKTLVSQTSKHPEKSSNSEEASDGSSHKVKKTTELNSKFNTQQTFEHETEKKNDDYSDLSQNSGAGTHKEGESAIVKAVYANEILNSSVASIKVDTPKNETTGKELLPLSLPNEGPISPIIDFTELQKRLASPTFLKNKNKTNHRPSILMSESIKKPSIESFLAFNNELKDNENKENEIKEENQLSPFYPVISQTSPSSVSPSEVLNNFEFYPSVNSADEVLEHVECEDQQIESQTENKKEVVTKEEEKELSQESSPISDPNNEVRIHFDSSPKITIEKPIILINNRDANELNHLDSKFSMDRSTPIHNRRNMHLPTCVIPELKRNKSSRSLNKSNLSDKSRDNKLDFKKKISDLDISPISSINHFSYEDFDGCSDFSCELSLQMDEKITGEFKGMLSSQFSPLKVHNFNRNFGRNKARSLYQGFIERLNRFFEEKNKKTDFFFNNKPLEEDITKSADNKSQAKNDPPNSVMDARSRKMIHHKESSKVGSFDSKLAQSFRKTIVFAKFKKNFSQSLRGLNTEAIVKKSFEDDKSSISEEAESDSQEEDGFKLIKQKILEHEKLLNMNFIYQNLKNIKSIAKEDFFIYLEEYISNNYQFYKVNKYVEQEFQEFQDLLVRNKEEVRSGCENMMTSFFYDEEKGLKFKAKIKEECELIVEPLFLTDEIDYKEYFYHTDLKNLKLVIDGDLDDNLSVEDPFSSSFLYDKLPNEDIFPEEKKISNILHGDHNKLLMSPKQLMGRKKSNFLYANKCTIFINDEDEFSNENSQVMGNRIKDNMEMNYFLIYQKINKFIEVFEKMNVCIRTRFDYETLKSLLAIKLELGKNELNQVFDENDAGQNKYFSLQKLGKAYLSINKENFRKFCEEHRDILFGYFEDYYHEINQTVDFEGEKRKNITFLVQGLPLNVSKNSFMKIHKNKSQIFSDHEVLKKQKSASYGAFLASRKKNIRSENNSNKTTPNTELNVPFTESLEDQRKQFHIVLSDLQQGNEIEMMDKEAKTRSKSDSIKKQGTKRNLLASTSHENKRKAAFEESKKSDKSLLTPKDMPKLTRQKSSRSLDVLKAQAQAHMEKNSPKAFGDDFSRFNKDKEVSSSGIRKKNEDEEHERGSNSGFFTKGVLNPLTKNLMSFNTYMIHLKKKKNLNVLDQFFFAIKEEKFNELEELIVNYPNILIDERDKENNTMLINAVRVGSLEMVSLILSKGPNLNLRNNEGNTALHYSLGYGYDKITNVLLRNGAIETIKNNEGKRPWDMVDYS